MIPMLVHVTQEAVRTLSAVGAALEGLLHADAYRAGIKRTILAGPMFAGDPEVTALLHDPAGGLAVRYSSLHGVTAGVDATLRAGFAQIERSYEVAILYGTRRFGAHDHEILLVDATHPNRGPLDAFKQDLHRRYAIDSAQFVASPEVERALSIALPLLEALSVLAPGGAPPGDRLLVAHDWQGLPLLFAAQGHTPGRFRTAFYAHESPTARALIERHPGHDTRFYNALFQAREWQLGVETVFGPQEESGAHALLRRAARCDALFAVGDLVVEELRFLGGSFYHAPIDLIYDGVSAPVVDWKTKRASRARLRDYAQALLGWRPDFVFTHVGRMELAGGYWRDARVLEHLDGLLRARGERAVLFIVAANGPAKSPAQVAAWEEAYGWPLHHRRSDGDLVGLEEAFDREVVEPFNARATNVHMVFVNQQGWSAPLCGVRMPAVMQPADLQQGTDVEFGQGIYAPSGSAPIEPLASGALCCVSSVSGSVGFVSRTAQGTENVPALIVADYCTLPAGYWLGSPYDALAIDQGVRDWIESTNSAHVARVLDARLPRSDAQARGLLAAGQEIAVALSWECVVRDALLPALARLQSAGSRP